LKDRAARQTEPAAGRRHSRQQAQLSLLHRKKPDSKQELRLRSQWTLQPGSREPLKQLRPER
jgi:hypothetical protein